jgi:hypothetical protein
MASSLLNLGLLTTIEVMLPPRSQRKLIHDWL